MVDFGFRVCWCWMICRSLLVSFWLDLVIYFGWFDWCLFGLRCLVLVDWFLWLCLICLVYAAGWCLFLVVTLFDVLKYVGFMLRGFGVYGRFAWLPLVDICFDLSGLIYVFYWAFTLGFRVGFIYCCCLVFWGYLFSCFC